MKIVERVELNKRRIMINATAFSEPGTMGGNTKIFLEVIRCLRHEFDVHVLVPESKVRTIEDALPERDGVSIHAFQNFDRSEFIHPVAAVLHYYKECKRILCELKAGADDFFFSASDFHVDAAVSFFLQLKFGFKWFPSAFLFVPNPVANLVKGYGFPFFNYVIAWVYSLVFMFFGKLRATGYVITNEDDFRHFPKRFRLGRLFPFYGGVNVDQIPSGQCEKKRDVVFCSRLCAQKGIEGFLDAWKIIHDKLPSVRLTLIGNGNPEFEAALHEKAERLGIAGSIDWLGYVNNEKKYEIYRSAKVFVHPTVFDNNGMVAAEALCSNLPVVMYDLPALRHVYKAGCVKVKFGDKPAFAEAVIRILSDDNYAENVRPSPEEVKELRAKWQWSHRVECFKKWLLSV